MKKLLVLAIVLMAAQAFAQGNAVGWYHGPLDAHNCPVPDPKETFLCAWDTEEVKISSKGAPYDDPKNMLVNLSFSVDFLSIATGAPGSSPSIVNKGTPTAQIWQITLPPAATPWKTCPFTISGFAQDGKGNASGTLVIDPTKCQ